jgi:hypothetical protein
MANLFDPDNAPEGEPLEIVVGDYIQWKRSDLVSDYPLALYTAQYVARISQGGNTEITLPATEQDGTYLFVADSDTTADFVAGYYHWQLEIIRTSDGNRIVVDRGDFMAVADLDVNGADPRTHAQIMIDKIESILDGKADSDVGSYSIAGRSLTKMTFAELMDARDRYKAEFAKTVTEERAKRGKPTGATVKVRFS